MLFVQPGLLTEETQKTKDKQQEKPVPSRYVCANCHTPVSDASCLLVIQGDSPNHYFANPDGLLFEILTFSWCQNLLDGSPSVWQNTWFDGYSWTVQYCSGCQIHMGWRYDGSAEPTRFYGIVRERLIEIEEKPD